MFQWQVFAQDESTAVGIGLKAEQSLSIGIQIGHFFNDKFRPLLHHFFNGTSLNGIQDAAAVHFRNIGWQLHLYFEDLRVAVFRINNVVLRQANVLGGDVAGITVQLHKVGRAQSRRSQKVVKGARRRAIALVANGLVGHDREVVELGF